MFVFSYTMIFLISFLFTAFFIMEEMCEKYTQIFVIFSCLFLFFLLYVMNSWFSWNKNKVKKCNWSIQNKIDDKSRLYKVWSAIILRLILRIIDDKSRFIVIITKNSVKNRRLIAFKRTIIVSIYRDLSPIFYRFWGHGNVKCFLAISRASWLSGEVSFV